LRQTVRNISMVPSVRSPIRPPALDHATNPRHTSTDKIIVIVDQVCFDGHDDVHGSCIVHERARA
jgi:hypothetical protein